MRSPDVSLKCAAVVEGLENRLLLAAAPVFATPLYDGYWLDGTSGRSIGIDAFDADGDELTITAVSSSADVQVDVLRDNPYARMRYVSADGAHIGDIVVQLFDDEAPLAVERFITLSTMNVRPNGRIVARGNPFYTNVPVHRVIDGFMMQTGDAANGDGTGGSPLGSFADEFHTDLSFAGAGVLAMANSGADTNNSQFFITEGVTDWLDDAHTIFGQVVSGLDTLESIMSMPTDSGNRPQEVPLLQSVEIFSSDQMGMLRLKAAEGFTGDATVTVTIDDGTGNTVEKVINIKPKDELEAELGDGPAIDAVGQQIIPAGQQTVINLSATDDGALDIDWEGSVVYGNVPMVVDSEAGTLTFDVPADFTGSVRVNLFAAEDAGWADVRASQSSFDLLVDRPELDIQHKISVPTNGSFEKSVIADGRLYAAVGQAGLAVYDLTDPANPTLLDTYDTSGYARDVAVSGNFAYVADSHEGLVVVDVTDPANITLSDSHKTADPVGESSIMHMALEVVVRDGLAYVAEYPYLQGGNGQNVASYYENTAGLAIYDVSDPANIALVGNLWNGLVNDGFAALEVYGDYVFASDFAGVIHSIDVSDPTDPSWLGYTVLRGSPWGMDLERGMLYVATSSGLEVFDVAMRPHRPVRRGWMNLDDGPLTVEVVNETAIVTTQSGFQFINVSNPRRMFSEFDFTAPAGSGAAISGSLLAMGMGSGGAVVADVYDLMHRAAVQGRRTILSTSGQTAVTILARGGIAYAYTSGEGTGDIQRIEVPDSIGVLRTITVRGESPTIGDVTIGGSVNMLDTRGVTVDGDITIDGTAGRIFLGDTGDEAGTIQSLVVGSPANPRGSMVVVADNVDGLMIDSDTPIRLLRVSQWLDSGGDNDIIETPWIGNIVSQGNFRVDLALDGTNARRFVLGRAVVMGTLLGVNWDIGGSVANITVRGWAANSQVRTTGSIGVINLGGTSGSDFLAGVTSEAEGGPARHAENMADFETAQRINAIRVTGVRGADRTSDFLMDSNFSAASIGAGVVFNCGSASGFWAKSDGSGREITRLVYRDLADGTRWVWRSVNVPDDMGDITVNVLDA
jgi:cyclophilin family peptidyl-prolyl cis-trans isomerase